MNTRSDHTRENSLKFYHIDRDYTKSLYQLKREIRQQYRNVKYIYSDGRKIHFIAE